MRAYAFLQNSEHHVKGMWEYAVRGRLKCHVAEDAPIRVLENSSLSEDGRVDQLADIRTIPAICPYEKQNAGIGHSCAGVIAPSCEGFAEEHVPLFSGILPPE